ncbi:uncharacterized protein HaLaN_03786, partial [Haematococcus lacustris]
MLFVVDAAVKSGKLPCTMDLARAQDLTLRVTLDTSDIPGNGTDGVVYISLQGSQGSSGEVCLSGCTLERGSSCSATITLPDVGEVQKLTLALRDGGSGIHSQWHLAQLTLLNVETGDATTFMHGQWIDKGASVDLTPGSTTNTYVVVCTSPAPGSEFDGKVELRLTDADGVQSRAIPLGDGQVKPALWRAGGTDTFSVKAEDMQVSSLQSVALNIKDGGRSSSWLPSTVSVSRPDSGEVARFTSSQEGAWLYAYWGWTTMLPAPKVQYLIQAYTSNFSDASCEADVYLTLHGERGSTEESKAFFSTQKGVADSYIFAAIDYGKLEVVVYTADARGAGTDGQVWFKLSGPNGDTEEMQLTIGGDDSACFARAGVDTFNITGPDVGEKPTVLLRLVEVLNCSSGLRGTYPCGTWLERGAAAAKALTQSTSVQALNAYKLHITTGALPGADFDGEAFVTITGYNTSTAELRLCTDGAAQASFVAGRTQEYEVKGLDVGTITAITLRIQPSEQDPAWMLEGVKAVNESTGSSAEFFYSGWLDKNTPTAELWRSNPFVDFEVTVYTADSLDSGFDGEVRLQLSGSNGSNETTLLVNESAALLPGTAETFAMRASDVGTIYSATLSIVATKKERRWQVDRVEVRRLSSPDTPPTVFLFRAWLDADTASSLTISKDLPLVDYQLVITTAPSPGSGFEGIIGITLHGEEGSSGEVKLSPPDAPPVNSQAVVKFEEGSSASLPLKAKNVGRIDWLD